MSCRIVDPGLPSSPPLYFDRESGQAVISARVADWRAVERGRGLGKFLMQFAACGIAFIAWYELTISFGLLYGIVGALVSMLIFGNIVPSILETALTMFLSRSVFSKRLEVIVTHEAIGLRTWFFHRGIRVDRVFDGQPLQLAFILRADPEAIEKAAGQKVAGSHLQNAKMLELMIRGTPRKLHEFAGSVTRRIRSIPVASMRVDHGERFTVVLNAALELTQRSPFETQEAYGFDGSGRDLDVPESLEDEACF